MITVSFDDGELEALYEAVCYHAAQLNADIQDDPRDMGLQKKYKRACNLREKIEIAVNDR